MMRLFRFILICAFSAALVFVVDVAGRCTSEASFAVQVCACTIKNRLAAGWTQGSILDHYYARSVTPSAASVETVRSVLAGEVACGAEYYLFSDGDVEWLGLDVDDAVVTVCRGKACVHGYGKGALRR